MFEKERILRCTISELTDIYRSRKATVREVVDAHLERIRVLDPLIGAYLCVFLDSARARADELDRIGYDGRALFGVPIAIKDNICIEGEPTTCASRILSGYRPPYSATAVERLLDAGAVILGKTNLDEFAMGSSCENSAFKVTRNPWKTDRSPGGSSGGSAAAVAAGMAVVALGSDTGGSIRQPASFCGLVGLKGTYGRVSRYGLVAFASSLDQIGPIARSVEDCARVMQVIAGFDCRDATTIPEACPPLSSDLKKGLGGLRIAIPSGIEGWEMDESVRGIFDLTVDELSRMGMKPDEVDLPGMDASIACYYVIANAEASSNLARYDGVKYGYRAKSDTLVDMYELTRGEGFGEEVKRRILLGTYVLSSGYYEAYYAKAQQVRCLIRSRLREVFKRYDLLLLPTSPTVAFKLGEKIADPIAMYLSDIFTTPANIAGIPAISMPAGCSEDGLPVGIQLMAGRGKESLLLRGASGLERMFRFNERFECKCDSGGKGK